MTIVTSLKIFFYFDFDFLSHIIINILFIIKKFILFKLIDETN